MRRWCRVTLRRRVLVPGILTWLAWSQLRKKRRSPRTTSMLTLDGSPLQRRLSGLRRWRIHSWRKVTRWREQRTARLELQLSLNIDTYFGQYITVTMKQSDEVSPFSSRMRSSSEFLYRNMRHSSAAERWLC